MEKEMAKVIAYKIGGKGIKKADGGPVFLLQGRDFRFHASKHCSFTKESCIELGYTPIYNKKEIVLDEEQLALEPATNILMQDWVGILKI